MANEIRVYMDERMRGRNVQDAFSMYCVAKRMLPIKLGREQMLGCDAIKLPAVPAKELRCCAAAEYAMNNGPSSPEDIVSAFESGLDRDALFGIAWRPMLRHEIHL